MYIDLSDFQNRATEILHIDDEIELDSLNIYGRDIKFIEPIKYKGNIYKVIMIKWFILIFIINMKRPVADV